ncbi:MAG: methyl-accepting chemotaxis protein, partial [Rubrivivax sp.]
MSLQESVSGTSRLSDRHLPAVALVGEVRAGVGNLRRFEKDAIIQTGNPEPTEVYLKRWNATLAETRKALGELEKTLGAEALPAVSEVRSGLDNYAKGFQTVAEGMMQGRFGDATYANEAMEPLKGDVRRLDDKLKALKELIDTAAQAERAAAASLLSRQAVFQGLSVLAIGALVVLVAWRVVRSITGPLMQAGVALDRLAEGDLTHKVGPTSRDELGQMMRRLEQTQDALRALVQTIQNNSQSVATATEQIAHGNQDLSARTERQAASLQQTAASMEQLTATVRNGVEHARHAAELTRAARDSATKGGDVVAQVVHTMAGIQESSRRIADITGAIDGIAFQTNILALNAAVEAARAGEQG